MMKKCLVFLSLLVLFVSMGWAEDPDYGDLPEYAESISPDGTMQQGVIGVGDVDWFTFTPTAHTLYRVTFHGEINTAYKKMKVYQADEFGDLHETIYHAVWSNDTSVRTFFIETGFDVYIEMYEANAAYSFYVETVGVYPPDGNSNDCASASPLAVDVGPIYGTLLHNPDGSLEADWLVLKQANSVCLSMNSELGFFGAVISCQPATA